MYSNGDGGMSIERPIIEQPKITIFDRINAKNKVDTVS